MDKYTVYVHISPDGKRYYGTTKLDVNQRWQNGRGYPHNKYFTDAIKKYGWDNIQHIVVVRGLTKDEAYWLEIELIKEFDTTNRNKGYNIEKGGEYGGKGVKRSEETKKKIRENHIDVSGKNNPMYGKYGKNNPNYGKQHTEESKRKISETMNGKYVGKNNPRAKSVICITTGRIFYTAKEGADYYGTVNTHIIACCKGKYKSAGKHQGKKLIWRYIKWNHNKKYRINSNN